MRPHDIAIEVNGELYFTINRFAWATHRSAPNVRFLMSYGNRIRKLKVRHFDGKPLIPYSELTEFPFTMPGRNSTEVYHYDEEGRQVTDASRDDDGVRGPLRSRGVAKDGRAVREAAVRARPGSRGARAASEGAERAEGGKV